MFDQRGKLIIIHEYQSQDLQPFLNPICKETYQALPKIYGKNRKKRYYTQPNQINSSMQQNRKSRECCSRQLPEYMRAVTDVKQVKKSKMDGLLNETKNKDNNRRRNRQNLHKQISRFPSKKIALQIIQKVQLPNLKDFHVEQLVERQSKHKVYHSASDPVDLAVNNLRNLKNRPLDNLRRQIKADFSCHSQYVQTQEKDFELSSMKKVQSHLKSFSGIETASNKRYYQHLQNEQQIKQPNNARYKAADIRSSNHSQDDAFSISSSAIQKGNKISTLFHKYKRKLSSKNSQDRPEKKRSQVYSVLSNGLFKIPQEEQLQDYLLNYRSLNEAFDVKALIKQKDFHIVPTEGKIYFGQIVNKKKNGKGITVSEKQIFQGKYHQNMKVEGCEKNRDGVYTGEFLEGKRHGKGRFVWNNGEIFDGQWRQGKKNGFGIWKSPKGDSYQGEWKDNRQTGSGEFVHYGGSKYRGEFKDFLKHGKGHEEFPNGDKYDGEYFEGKPHGRGKYVWENGDTYQGNFSEGSRFGYGVLNRKNGQIYQGYFQNDLKHGKGKEMFRSGQQFEGEFKNGERLCGSLKTKTGALIHITQ